MYNLVWKDFLLLKRFLWVALLYGFAAPLAFKTMQGGALSAATVGTTYMLMIQACTQDDKNKSEIMLNSLPLRRRDIVAAKYLSVFLYAIPAILSFFFAQLVVSVTGIPITIYQISLEGIAGALVAMAVLMSIYFPIYFKFGYLRSRMVGMFLFFACFFFVPMAVALTVHGLEGMGNPTLRNIAVVVQRVLGWLLTQADWQIACYLLALSLVLMIASACLSLRFYSKREF
ncbi:MAG: ABC-2 transporter permease [Bacillota bacterium]|nr:ABC-2 transporter permease [Bacillota bacterium]